jgi:uncharacterized protein (DUF302 family)
MTAGLVSRESAFDPRETLQRTIAAITARGMGVMARIDHAGAAAQAGLPLRPTEVIVFGNPKAGTPLMQSAQTLGIDLPLKILVWQDEAGKTWLGYNDPAWLAERHGVAAANAQLLEGMEQALAAIAAQASTP